MRQLQFMLFTKLVARAPSLEDVCRSSVASNFRKTEQHVVTVTFYDPTHLVPSSQALQDRFPFRHTLCDYRCIINQSISMSAEDTLYSRITFLFGDQPGDRLMSYFTFKLQELQDYYDYIIIGGGTAGCVLANRLSKDRNKSVLLLERGEVGFTWASRVPLFSSNFPADTIRNRKLLTEPQEKLGGRKFELVVGNALGGTSRINAMLYTRGLPAEFNAWHSQGRKGWSYDELYPYFLKSQHSSGDAGSRNTHEAWTTRRHPKFFFKSSSSALKAAEALGFAYTPDVNSSKTTVLGIAGHSYTIDEHGFRNDTASAFLPPQLVKSRKNHLNVCTGVLVTKLHFSSDHSLCPRAVGVQIEAVNDRSNSRKIMANKEIILCAGAIGSPQLLLLSGIGPKDHLSDLNIEVIKDLPGVGNHLQDHLGIPSLFRIPLKDSMTELEKRPLVAIKEILKYIVNKKGLLLSPIHELSLYAQSRNLTPQLTNAKSEEKLDWTDPANIPDLEIMTIAFGGNETTSGKNFTHSSRFGLWTGVIQPFSRGYVRLQSSDPRLPPLCNPNYLGDSRDKEVARAGILLSLRLKEEMAKQGYPILDSVVPKSSSDVDLDAHIIKAGVTLYHYSSSCRMAPEDDPLPGVVDDELKVHGIDGLRIADASIFPSILATHLQAAVAAVGEKCAGMVLKESSSKISQ